MKRFLVDFEISCFLYSFPVCGLGYGVIAGAFSLANTLSHAAGAGTLGLPALLKMSDHFGDYTFFLMSGEKCHIFPSIRFYNFLPIHLAINTGAIVLLHVAYSVIFWYGCENKKYLYVAGVCVTHLSVTGIVSNFKYSAHILRILGTHEPYSSVMQMKAIKSVN